MDGDERKRAGAGKPRRLDIAGMAAAVDLGPHQAGVERQVHDHRGDDDARHRVAEPGGDADGEHEEREGHDRVEEAADDAVGPAAGPAGDRAERGAEDERRGDGDERDAEIDAGGDDDPAEHVAAELVGAEEMGGRRRLQGGGRVGGERVVGNDPRPEHRHHQDRGEEEQGEGVGRPHRPPERPRQHAAQPSKRTLGSRKPEAMSMTRLMMR